MPARRCEKNCNPPATPWVFNLGKDMNEGRQPEEQLAAWADHALKQLPARKAPATLAPRILAALARQRALPWYRQPWFNWPRHFQVLSFALAALVVAGLAWVVVPHADGASLEAAKQTAAQLDVVKPVATTFDVLGTLGNATALLLKNLSGWALAALLGGAAFLWCSTIGLGTAAWRLAAGER